MWFSNISLIFLYARRKWKDEPFAFEAREFLRKKLIGQEVKFLSLNAAGGANDREQGKIFFPDDTDIAEELVANGLAEVRKPGGKVAQESGIKRLCELEEKAKREKKENIGKIPAK